MDERHFEIQVPTHQSRIRIDVFLANELAGFSRSQIQHLIQDQWITVDHQGIKANHLVRHPQTIQITIPKPPPADVLPESIPLDIVFEDDHLIVLNKPAGMVVHPACGHFHGTLVNALLGHTSHLSDINGRFRPGIVHRIDKDTSGLLVVAKDTSVHHHLAKQFSEKTVQRNYCAVVWGKPENPKGSILSRLVRSSRDRRKMTVSETGKIASTQYELSEEFPLCSVLRLILGTGRTHQIRVHLAYIGNPVLGDPTYGGRTKPLIGLAERDLALGNGLLQMIHRQALHAKTLGFIHPVTGKLLFFDSEIPEDMKTVIDRLKMEKEQRKGKK